MIYLFNDVKELTGTVRNNHILNLLYEREKNGIYSVSAEIPVTYNDQGMIYNYNKKIQKSDFLGHYDKEGRFQLHKIAAVDIENGSIFVKGIHIFFDEAKAGAIIQDRRFINREIIDGARVAFESIGWSVADFDVSVGKTYNFYNVTPLEARQILVETFGFEFDYWLDFDGKKVTNRHVAVKEKIGEKTNKRYTYGHNVLNIRAEQDYSEIYTAVIGRGKGEEIEETGGYGRRIEYTDVVWSKPSKPLNKPAGTRILEDPNATQLFGYKENGVVKPRVKVEVFSDIESPTELIQASYEWLMDNNVPKAVFSLKVADGDGLNLGDEVYVIYRDIDLIKSARVEKVTDDLVSGNRDVEFGDTAYFDTDRRLSGLRSDLKRYSGETGDRIYQLKMEFNRRFDEEVSSWVSEFEQNLIDQKALIEADRENMTNLIEGTRTEFTDNLNAEITQTKEYAEQQAQTKAEEVRTDLGTVTSGHQAMIDSLQDNVMNIDDFLGDKTFGLNELLYNERMLFEERINSINTWHYNLLRETHSLDSDFWEAVNGTIETDSNGDSYYRSNVSNDINRSLYSKEGILFEAGETYTLSFQVQTYGHRSMDYVWIIGTDSAIYDGNYPLHSRSDEQTADNIYWSGQYRSYYITFTMPYDVYGRVRIGGNYNNNELGAREYRIKKPYLTQSDNKQWLHNPEDSLQNIEEVTRRVMLLEDGREEFITRTQYDFETGEINGTIKSVLETVDESLIIIQNHEDWVLTNGASIERTVDGFESKAWLSDIHNPNIIPYSAVHLPEHYKHWTGSNTTVIGTSYQEWLRVRTTNNVSTLSIISNPFSVVAGQQYTVTWYAWFDVSAADLSREFDYSYIQYSSHDNVKVNPTRTTEGTIGSGTIYKYKATFTTQYTDENATFIFGTTVPAATAKDLSFRFNRPKLEVGDRATPYHNAFSNLSQRADEIMLAVKGVDTSGFLSQSDIQIVPDYVQIGSQRLDGSNIGSLLRVSPTGIDMVAEAMRLSGDLYVEGDITALAVNAIEGNFARLFANQLTANVITADHIQVGTQLVDKLFATSARIDELITKTHFVNEMHALTLNVVELNASEIRARLLTANTIEAEWLKSGTALVDRIFSSNAMFGRMMAKSGFVTSLSAITLDLHELTIWRPDGVAFVQNGMERFGHPVPLTEYIEDGVEYNGRVYSTAAKGTKIFKIAYGDHAGRNYNLVVGVGLRWDSASVATDIGVVIRPSSVPAGLNWNNLVRTFRVTRGESMQWHTLRFDMGKPTYAPMSFTIEFYRIDEWAQANYVEIRTGRSWVSA